MTEYLTGPRRLAPSFDADPHLARLDEDGFTIVEDYMSAGQLASFREGLKPYLGTYRGRNSFEGLATQRVYTLVGRGKVYEDIASDQRLLAILDGLLAPNGANRSNAPRLAFTNQYCEPWARPQENFYLGVPKEKVRAMSREMQILLGYELRRPGDIMGQVGGYHPIKTLDPDFVLPVLR
jgi:ectoine hydroxylase-related dioxygenase (phytanoyl-CoA dioxygenase family)